MGALTDQASPLWSLSLAGQPMMSAGDGTQYALAPRDAALLAWLALEGPTQRQRLAELLWPESSADAARNVLRQRVFQLKKQFGDGLLVVGRNTLALHPSVEHDLQASDDVLSPLGGEFSGEFGQWLESQRLSRLQRRSDALAAAAERAEAESDWAAALQCARQLLVLNPLSEAAHRRVMHLHYLAGDRAAALLAFDACERCLKDEVGTRPAAETLQLLGTIEQSQPGSAFDLTTAGRVPASVQRPPRLVGRDALWRRLQQAWTDQGWVTLSGEPGAGKTRLLTDLTMTLGVVALSTSARPGDDAIPHALMARLARSLLARVGTRLPPSQLRELSRVLPELGTPPPISSRTALALHEALAELLHQAHARGVGGVIVDDLHFADAASLGALRSLCATTPAIAWIVAFRPNQLTDAGRELTAVLQRSARSYDLYLDGLDEQAITELIGSLGLGPTADAALALRLLRRTGGNPLFVLETLKAALQQGIPLAGPLPTAHNVTQLIVQRLSGLSPGAIKLARCAAIAGQDFGPALATEVLGAGPLDLADGWSELESAQLLRDNSFSHDLIQDAALGTVPPSLARRLHTLVAQYLVANKASAQRIASHWEASETPLEAVPYLLDSGRQAALALCLEDARHAYLRAAELLRAQHRDQEAFDALLELLERLYNPSDQFLRETLDHLGHLATTPLQRAHVAERRADALARFGDFETAGQVAANALLEFDNSAQPAIAAKLLCRASVGDLARGEHDAAIERMHRATELAAKSNDPDAIGTTANYFGSVLEHCHRYAEAYLAHRHAFELAQRRQAEPMEQMSIAANIAGNRTHMGMFDTALEMVQWAYRIAGENTIDLDAQWPALRAHHGLSLRGLGQYRQAIRVLEDAHSAVTRYMPAGIAAVCNMQVVLWMELGQWSRAMQAAQAALQSTAGSASRYHTRTRILMNEIQARSQQTSLLSTPADVQTTDNDDNPLATHQTGLARVTSMTPSEGYAFALELRTQALARQMPTQVLEAEVRCADTARALGQHALAAQHARAALQRMRETLPTTLYRADVWLSAAEAFSETAPAEFRQVVNDAERWIRTTARDQVPEEFRDSFLNRNPTNRALLELSAHLASIA